MAVTVLKIVDAVKARPGAAGIPEPDIAAAVYNGIVSLAYRIAADPARRSALQTRYTVAVTSGTADIASYVNPASSLDTSRTILAPPFPSVTFSGTPSNLEYVPDEEVLTMRRPNRGVGYYTVVGISTGPVIKCVNGTGSTTGMTGTLTMTVQFIPNIANFPTQLEQDLVNEVAASLGI